MIYVVGDIHAKWDPLNAFIEDKKPSLILQCGDWGYWPAFDGLTELGDPIYGPYGMIVDRTVWNLNDIKSKDAIIHWCDGNHEDHWALKEFGNKVIETQPNCFYQPRGSTLTLPDGRVVLFMGGAYSIDKNNRTEGVDWFREETISYIDVENLPDCRVDIVISHTCPTSFIKDIPTVGDKRKDSSCGALEYVLDRYKPDLWYFGHFHQHVTGFDKGCRWTCLDMVGETGWYEKLK